MTNVVIKEKCSDCHVEDILLPFESKKLCTPCYVQTLKGKIVECECCPNKIAERAIKIYGGNMKMCPSCFESEIKAQREIVNNPVKQQERIDASTEKMNEALAKAKEIDAAVQVRTDLFNAATVSIVELKKTIDSDETVTNKNYMLAQTLLERFEHHKAVIFEANAVIVEATNNQKAIQVYLNTLANQLRQEERDKLKIQDINYKPKEVKPVKPRAVKTAKAKLNKEELRKYAAELGVSEFTLQMLVVSKGITVEAAANLLRKSVKEAISESKPVDDGLPAVEMDSIEEVE